MSTATGGGSDGTGGEDESLICGFGPRRARSDSSRPSLVGDGDGRAVPPPAGGGRGAGDAGQGGEAGNGGDADEGELKRSLICGWNDGTRSTYATASTAGEYPQYPPGDGGGGGGARRPSAGGGDGYVVPDPSYAFGPTTRVPTKTDDGRSGPPLRRAGSSSSLSGSIGSFGSLASEDAIVLMSGLGAPGPNGGPAAPDGHADDKVVGRVFRNRHSMDYDEIPRDLEIERDTGWAAVSMPNLGRAAGGRRGDDPEGLKSSFQRADGGLDTSVTTKMMEIHQQQLPQLPHRRRRPSREGGRPQAAAAGEPSSGARTVSFGGGPAEAPPQPAPRRPRLVPQVRSVSFGDASPEEAPPPPEAAADATPPRREYFRRMSSETEALCVIAEDDSSDGGTSAASSPGRRGRKVPGVSFPHARSMARQLSGREAGREKAPKRGLHRKSSSRRRLEEEGRLAIVSRNSEKEYVRVVVPKTDEVKKLILESIRDNILFKACSDEELAELVEVFAPQEMPAGSTVMRQGDEGDGFYVMERGTIDVYVGDTYRVTLYSGASFGEIALLYNCPRSATLRTGFDCKLWGISRAAFRAITSQFKQRRTDAKVSFLKKVKIKNKLLSDVLSDSELNALALATLTESYKAGDTIVHEGEVGDIFYMIDSGSVDVLIKSKGSGPVVTLGSGKFFGELALLSSDVRTASCVAKTDVKCHILMRKDFNQLLGDLQSLMDGRDYRTREKEMAAAAKRSTERSKLQVNLEDLEILKVLGVGAFGRVRLVKMKQPVPEVDGEYFALKCISKKSLKENGLDTHIQNEKAIMATLEHPFINRFYCDMEDDGFLYFLLEALPGGELCKRLREERKFPEPWGMFYSASVLFAFCHMHAKKIAYRDLKPENLVMDAEGYVKVVDFGLAKVISGGKTWTLCGTPAYLAPEIVLNDGHDWAVDYWALGVLLFEMTSGREPFAAKSPMEVYKQIVSGHVDIPTAFSSTLADLIVKLLNASKSKRLGRTLGGGGAVMQHRWYSDFDWDAYLERKMDAPLRPKTKETLSEESVTSESRGSTTLTKASSKTSSSPSKNSSEHDKYRGAKPPRLTYSLGQGNRHHQKMLEMMDSSYNDTDAGKQVDTVRMTMMRVIKQHENWSRDTKDSTNSSTRNTSLGVDNKPVLRSSVNSESHLSVESSGFGENLDAFLRLQLMHLSLASKKFTTSLERDKAYQQFSVLSTCGTSIVQGKADILGCGDRFLDPFVTKKSNLIDQFPGGLSESDIDADALAAFCFPNGIRLRLVPRRALDGARRLGWLGPKGDSYQLQGFTDVAGSLTHGCAITIREELDHDMAREVTLAMCRHRERRRGALLILRWWRRHSRPTRSLSKNSRSARSVLARSQIIMGNGIKWGRKASGDDALRHSTTGIKAAMDTVMTNAQRRLKSAGDIAFEGEDDSCGFDPLPQHVRNLGIEAYQAMIEAEEEGDVCIVEKSYVITGTNLQDQCIFFYALHNLIQMEREYRERQRASPNNQNGISDLSHDRHKILAALQSKLSLTPLQRRVAHPRDEMAHVMNPQRRRFVVDLTSMGFSKISVPLPLPEVSGQWGVSTLFLRIKDSGLIILLKLLLLERSVLVVGETSEEVTACTTALLELLDPYKWASAFMPLLPRDMLDFVSSPVPFIAGMIVENKQHLNSIIQDHGVKDAMLHGLSVVNLVSGKLIVTREQGTSDMLRRSFQTIPELSLYQKRLEEYCSSPTSNLRSFDAFFKHGASRKESLTILRIKRVIKKHMSQFTLGLTDKPDAWRQYGEFNEASGAFDFCPDKFIQPLKDRMIFQIQFQEMMAHTQLFVGYVEELQIAREKRGKLLSGPAAKFIASWVELHWNAKSNGQSVEARISRFVRDSAQK